MSSCTENPLSDFRLATVLAVMRGNLALSAAWCSSGHRSTSSTSHAAPLMRMQRPPNRSMRHRSCMKEETGSCDDAMLCFVRARARRL